MRVSFLSRSFLTIIDSILGKIPIITPHQIIFLFIIFFRNQYLRTCSKYVQNTYKWWSIYCKWLTTIVCIHFCQTYLTELPILLNPSLLLSRISDNSKFFNGPVKFEITRFNCNVSLRIWVRVRIMIFNATFNNILIISWWSVLLVEETRVSRENHRPAASHCQPLSHKVVSSLPRYEWIETHISGDRHWLQRLLQIQLPYKQDHDNPFKNLDSIPLLFPTSFKLYFQLKHRTGDFSLSFQIYCLYNRTFFKQVKDEIWIIQCLKN